MCNEPNCHNDSVVLWGECMCVFFKNRHMSVRQSDPLKSFISLTCFHKFIVHLANKLRLHYNYFLVLYYVFCKHSGRAQWGVLLLTVWAHVISLITWTCCEGGDVTFVFHSWVFVDNKERMEAEGWWNGVLWVCVNYALPPGGYTRKPQEF